jgi:hypothetical protein
MGTGELADIGGLRELAELGVALEIVVSSERVPHDVLEGETDNACVCVLVTPIVAPGTTAPVGSVTVPVMLPKVDWPAAVLTKHRTTNRHTADTVRTLLIWKGISLLNSV